MTVPLTHKVLSGRENEYPHQQLLLRRTALPPANPTTGKREITSHRRRFSGERKHIKKKGNKKRGRKNQPDTISPIYHPAIVPAPRPKVPKTNGGQRFTVAETPNALLFLPKFSNRYPKR